INVESAAAVSNGLRRERAEIGKFVSQHDDRVADHQLRMHDFAIRTFHYSSLLGAERLFVELNCFRCVANREIRSQCVVSIGNWFHCHKASWKRISGQFTPGWLNI